MLQLEIILSELFRAVEISLVDRFLSGHDPAKIAGDGTISWLN